MLRDERKNIYIKGNQARLFRKSFLTSKGRTLEIRECPQCKGDMRYYKASAFWICNNSPQCSGVLSDTMETTEAGINSNYSIELVNICCPLCGASMKAKKGLISRITCSSEKCDFTFDQRLSAGLMRILRKKDR